ncbi:MAG TPA: MFS transporter [Capillimicrobium sp.]|nr:MFS transporter [Capillimicrobium sp.]
MEAKAATAHLPSQRSFLAAIGGVFAATLVGFLAVGAVLPVLPRYVHGPVGAGDVAVGITIGAFSLSAILTRPWAGRLADERGRRMIVVAGAALMGAGGALLFVPAGVPGLVGSRLVLGVGEAFVFTAGSAWVVDLAPRERRAQSIGLFGLSVWGGLAAGPAIGEALDALGGYDLVWAFAALAPLAGAAIAWRQPSTPPAADGGAPERRRTLIAREAVLPGIPLALANAGYAVLAGFVVLHLEARGSGHGAAVFAAFAVAMVATRVLAGGRPDRWGPRRSATAAGLAEGAGLAIIALAHAWPLAMLGGVVMGCGFALLYPALASVVVERAGEARRGAALGSLTAFFDAGFGLGGPLAGAVAALGGYDAAFWVGAGFGIAAGAMAWRVARSTETAAPR